MGFPILITTVSEHLKSFINLTLQQTCAVRKHYSYFKEWEIEVQRGLRPNLAISVQLLWVSNLRPDSHKILRVVSTSEKSDPVGLK